MNIYDSGLNAVNAWDSFNYVLMKTLIGHKYLMNKNRFMFNKILVIFFYMGEYLINNVVC